MPTKEMVNGPVDLIGLTKRVKDKYIKEGLFNSVASKESDIRFFNKIDKYYRKFILVIDNSEDSIAFIKELYKGITKLYKELLTNNSTSDYYSILLTDFKGLEESGLKLSTDLACLLNVMLIRYNMPRQVVKDYATKLIDLIRSKTIISLQELFIKALPNMKPMFLLNDHDIITLCRTDVTDNAVYNRCLFSAAVSETEYERINPKLQFTIREAECVTPYLALFISLEANYSRNNDKILTICRELFDTILELGLDRNPMALTVDKESVLCYYDNMHSLIPKDSLPTLADYMSTFGIIAQVQIMFLTHLVKRTGEMIGIPLVSFIESLAKRLQVSKEILDVIIPRELQDVTVTADNLDELTLDKLAMLNEGKSTAEPVDLYSNSVTKPKRGRKKTK